LSNLPGFGPLDRCAFTWSTASSHDLFTFSTAQSILPPSGLQASTTINPHAQSQTCLPRFSSHPSNLAEAISATTRHGVPAKACPPARRRPRNLPTQRRTSNRKDPQKAGFRPLVPSAMEESAWGVYPTVQRCSTRALPPVPASALRVASLLFPGSILWHWTLRHLRHLRRRARNDYLTTRRDILRDDMVDSDNGTEA
jgi:hypothetical protein